MLACLVAAPLVLSDYQLMLFSTGVAYAVSVLGVALGFSSVGMLALAQPAMMVIGGYVTLHLIELWNIPFLLAASIATIAGMAIALPLGWLTCRLDKFAFAVLGFAFTYLVAMLMSSGLLADITGGELGKPFPVRRGFRASAARASELCSCGLHRNCRLCVSGAAVPLNDGPHPDRHESGRRRCAYHRSKRESSPHQPHRNRERILGRSAGHWSARPAGSLLHRNSM